MSRANEADLGQPSTRRWMYCTDQHGRKWGGSGEKRSGFPISLKPSGWRAPWIPAFSTDVFKFDENDPSSVRINYDFLLEERLQAAKEDAEARESAAVIRGWDPADPEKQDALDKIAGKRGKLQPPEVIVGCMMEDPWLLGLTDVPSKYEKYIPKKVNRREALLSKFAHLIDDDETEESDEPDVPERQPSRAQDQRRTTYNEFVKEQRKLGHDMAEIALLWKAEKAKHERDEVAA